MSEQINDGGPAFPIPGLQNDADFNGMSLRDYFAAKAMHGVHVEYLRYIHPDAALTRDDYHNMAADAYTLADAMLRARQQ